MNFLNGHRWPLPGRWIAPVATASLLALCSSSGQAQVILETHQFNGTPLPGTPADMDPAGMADSRVIASTIGFLTDVNVTIELTNPTPGGAYNGDYYLTLTHDSGFAVLLNRVGRRTGSSFDETLGYGDNGLRIRLDDQAVNGDVHVYRLQLSATPGGGPANSHNTVVDANFVEPLTGTWASDGRNVNPLTVTEAAPRTATLGAFNSLSGSGRWTLFLADLNLGGTATLLNWSLELSGTAAAPVPEPNELVGAVAVVLLLGAGWREFSRPAGSRRS